MTLKRTDHWATREFDTYLKSHAHGTFKYGALDCCLMAADAIHSMTGVDIAADFRGKYSTELGALKAIKSITGGTSVLDAIAYCASKHGLTEWKSPLLAQRGDLVAIKDGEQTVAGIVHLNGRHAITIGKAGLVRYPLTAVVKAYKV